MPVRAFTRIGKPPSFNKWRPTGNRKHRVFLEELQARYTQAGGTLEQGSRYGLVTMFVHGFDTNRDPDADNLSKPVWDSLTSVAYEDDSEVMLRIASVVDVGPLRGTEFTTIDPNDFPEGVLVEIEALLRSGTGHFIYVEVGPLLPNMAFRGLGTWSHRGGAQ